MEIEPTELPNLVDAGSPLRTPEFATTDAGEVGNDGGLLRNMGRVFAQNKLALISLVFLIFVVLFCFVGPSLYHTNQTNAELALSAPQNAAPSHQYPLGTDGNGFNILGRIMYGGQISLIVGFLAAIVSTVVGVVYGAFAGFFGSWVDPLAMRIVDIGLSIPGLFLLIALVTIWRPSASLLILVIAAVSWLVPARLIRAETLSLKTRDYVQAVKAMGGRRSRIIGRHIIPNSIGTIVVFATFTVADSILFLAALGFLGLGVPAPQTDWGTMLSNGVNYAADGYWWEIWPVGIVFVLVIVALNYLGDALRDALEVRLQRH
jgi:peptide/nickel transport system permease protein